RLARERHGTPLTRLRPALLPRRDSRDDHDRPVGETDMLPAKRTQLALAEAGEARDGVHRSVLSVGELLLRVLLLARPPTATVHVTPLPCGPGERQDLFGGERVGRLGVVLAPL